MAEETKKPKQGETKEITKKATDDKDKDFKTSGIEGTKEDKSAIQNPQSEIPNPKSEIVRGEDVVKMLRAKGVKI